jgi:hypothetical protein
MNKKYEKYCPGCGKAYKSDTIHGSLEDVSIEEDIDYEYEHDQINEINVIDAEYEQGVADAEANEEPRPFKQMQGKKWTGKKEYMNDYIPPTDIKDIGKE